MDSFYIGVGRDLVEKELGRTALAMLESLHGKNCVIPAVETEAIRLLEAIRSVLDNENLSDFDCIEEIVDILWHAGIVSNRHDFG